MQQTMALQIAWLSERRLRFKQGWNAHGENSLTEQQIAVPPELLAKTIENEADRLIVFVLQFQLDVNVGMQGVKGVKAWRQPALGKGGFAADAERARARSLAHLLDTPNHRFKRRHQFITQLATSLRQPDTTVQTFKQINAELDLQPLDVTRDRNRRHGQFHGCFLEALMARGSLERTKGIEIQRHPGHEQNTILCRPASS